MTHGRDLEALETGRDLLVRASRVLVLTGAGISADSGLATFRGEDGLWRNYRPQELATPEAFARDPRLVWEWYGMRREAAASCEPNAAHLALARLATERDGVTLVTQNVDGLHTRAAERIAAARPLAEEPAAGEVPVGTPAQPAAAAVPLELHGCLFRVRCTHCGERYGHREPIDASSVDTLPSCRSCASMLRPDIVWFGEPLGAAIEIAFAKAQEADLCLVVGTSAVVQPAASLATVVDRAGGTVVEVNPEPTPLTPLCAVSLRGGAADIVPLLVS
jgi:NAD-dependent deacetylase